MLVLYARKILIVGHIEVGVTFTRPFPVPQVETGQGDCLPLQVELIGKEGWRGHHLAEIPGPQATYAAEYAAGARNPRTLPDFQPGYCLTATTNSIWKWR